MGTTLLTKKEKMDEIQKKEVNRILEEFNKIKNKKTTAKDEEILLFELTGMLGIYHQDPEAVIEDHLQAMINYAKKRKWAVQGIIIQYNKIRDGKL